jgi:hypothetical protein
MRTRILPTFNPYYCSFYLHGIGDHGPMRYSTRDFEDLLPCTGDPVGLPPRISYELASIIDGRRIFIATSDHTAINERAVAWADVYGQVNLDPGESGRIVPVGPSFGVRSWGVAGTMAHFIRTYAKGKVTIGIRRHASLYRKQWHRAPLSAYIPQHSDSDYVFFAAWPWTRHPDVNPPRARFIEACQSTPGLEFEGGFVPRWRHDHIPGLEGLAAPKRYSLTEYLEKVKRSAFVYNTPAVHQCLGWKLGEFLALGKAIISLPLTRRMPAPVEHGVHAHFVDGSDGSLRHAIEYLRGDLRYRKRLEDGAREYWEAHLTPARVIERLLAFAP